MTIVVEQDYTVYDTEVVNATGTAFYIHQISMFEASPSLYVFGKVFVTGNGATGVVNSSSDGFYAQSIFRIEEGGEFHVSSTGGGTARGFDAGSWSANVTNNGLFEITSQAAAFGVVTWDAGPFQFLNTGTFTLAAKGFGEGVHLVNGGDFINSGDMRVSGGNDGSIAVELNSWDITFDNSGTIVAKANHGGVSIGLVVAHDDSFTSVIDNSGLIRADVAIFEDQIYSPLQESSQQVENTGTIQGIIDLGLGPDVINNNGRIYGDIYFDGGADTYNGASGVLRGAVHGGDGIDTFNLGSADDFAYGEGQNDTIYGGKGADMLDGGRESDVLYGGLGDDYLVGGFANDTLDGGKGADRVDAGDQLDTIVLSQAAFSLAPRFDTVVAFNFLLDKFDLATAVSAIGAQVNSATLNGATLGSDLAGVLPSLAAHSVVVVHADAGDLAGQYFLVVDFNGSTGFQSASDAVMMLENAVNLASLDLADFI